MLSFSSGSWQLIFCGILVSVFYVNGINFCIVHLLIFSSIIKLIRCVKSGRSIEVTKTKYLNVLRYQIHSNLL